jgi:hypothetical protein
VVSDGATLFVGLGDGTVAGYPLSCEDPCQPVWTADVGETHLWNLAIAGPSLYVVSGSPLQQGLHVFAFRATS